MCDGRTLALEATAVSALVFGSDGERACGPVAASASLPAATRRRLTPFDLAVARCLAPFAGGDTPIVFASRYGNMGATVGLLTACVSKELLSPAAFSVSVHNAAGALASQLMANRGGHTAVAGRDGASLSAGLTEAYVRLADDADEVLFIYADAPLPEPYTAFDEGPEGESIALAMALRRAEHSKEGIAVSDGRSGAIELVNHFSKEGRGVVTWRL
jgi:hypothetical protein